MNFGPEDFLEFALRYLPSFAWSVLICAVTFIAGIFVVRRRPHFRRVGSATVCLAAVPLVCWIVYFVSTSKLSYTLVSLGSESSHVAERTYLTSFKAQVTTVDSAVRLALSKHQEPNVRFYACCLIADMLETNSSAEVEGVLKRVENAGVIQTQLIGGNSLTEGFYVPGHAQVELPPREIIERRIRMLRAGTGHSHDPS